MNDPNRLTHSVWDCKYHIIWIPKYRRKRLYGGIAQDLGKIFHELARQRGGRACVPGSYPHADRNTAEVRRIHSGRVYQREERNSDSPNISWETAKFQRTKFLGAWILCVDRRPRRGIDQKIYPRTGSRRSTARPIGNVQR